MLAALLHENRPCTNHTGGWVVPRAGLDRHRKFCPLPGFDLWTIHPNMNSVLAMLSLLIYFFINLSHTANGCTISQHSLCATQYTLPISLQDLECKAFGCLWSQTCPPPPWQLQIRWNSEGSRSGLQAGKSRTSISVCEGCYFMDNNMRTCTLM